MKWALLLFLALSACRRAPQNAAQLLDELPRHFEGQIHWQGDANGQRVRIDTRELTVRTEHVLEFNGMNVVQLNPDGGVVIERYAPIRGKILTPECNIEIEELRGDGEDALKAGTFKGKLSPDLQTVEAEWTTAFGTKGSLKLSATSK